MHAFAFRLCICHVLSVIVLPSGLSGTCLGVVELFLAVHSERRLESHWDMSAPGLSLRPGLLASITERLTLDLQRLNNPFQNHPTHVLQMTLQKMGDACRSS